MLNTAQKLNRSLISHEIQARFISKLAHRINISEEVKHAINSNIPVVALESTIITHGLPYPENIGMAKTVESLIRDNGCVPATIAFVKGMPTVGVNSEHLEILGLPDIHNVKISRRDIPNVMARKLTGGTTIASTMMLANIAGIDVFSTGGLGGVSRPWTLSDVSADLDELGKTPVAVVCSGPKSILDIQRTMEYLETKGVPVSTYVDEAMRSKIDPYVLQRIENIQRESNSDARSLNEIGKFWDLQKYNVPGFYVRDSGVRSPFVWENPRIAADMIYNGKYRMEMENGYVFCAPAPIEVALDKTIMDEIIDEALQLAEQYNVTGKELTPFLLQTLYEKTNGKSAKVNVEFVKNNAILGSKIAAELSNLKSDAPSIFQPSNLEEKTEINNTKPLIESKLKLAETIVVGSVAVDTMCRIINNPPLMNDSNPGKIMDSKIGGVGFNTALAASRSNADSSIMLITAINKNDVSGKLILSKMKEFNMSSEGLINISNENTAQYISMHDTNGNLVVACADMDIITNIPSNSVLKKIEEHKPKYILLDMNISSELADDVFLKAMELDIKIMVEPTSGVKCSKLGLCNLAVFPQTPVELLTPTIEELAIIHASLAKNGKFEDIDGWFTVLDALGINSQLRERLVMASRKFPLLEKYLQKGVFQQAFQLLPYFPRLVIKDGSNGVLVVQIETKEPKTVSFNGSDFHIVNTGSRHRLFLSIAHYPAFKVNESDIVNVTGAGDTLAGYLLSKGLSVDGKSIQEAQKWAAASVCSPDAVPNI
ncbi:hypothetical protein DAPK24_028930 [Pichia kluyveri]|uniref:Carbohydrate kinase PfkB domain-containing protein n=1 Tax=Pichia kluyveri TaxID=36015 RepID=A0AAV5R661_PICKL|nr:hypothetical protein DAPK24_028930 [Pichia kluyveri]